MLYRHCASHRVGNTVILCVSACVHVQSYLLSKQIIRKHMLDTVSGHDVSRCIPSHFHRVSVVLRAMQCSSATTNQMPTGCITLGWRGANWISCVSVDTTCVLVMITKSAL